MKKRIMCFILAFVLGSELTFVTAAASSDVVTLADDSDTKDTFYTWTEWLAKAGVEASKFVAFLASLYGGVTSGDFAAIATDFDLYSQNMFTGEWAVHVDGEGNVTYSDELVALFKQFLEDYYGNQVTYDVFRTNTHEQNFDEFLDFKNLFTFTEQKDTMITVSDINDIDHSDVDCNSLQGFLVPWNDYLEGKNITPFTPQIIISSGYGVQSIAHEYVAEDPGTYSTSFDGTRTGYVLRYHEYDLKRYIPVFIGNMDHTLKRVSITFKLYDTVTDSLINAPSLTITQTAHGEFFDDILLPKWILTYKSSSVAGLSNVSYIVTSTVQGQAAIRKGPTFENRGSLVPFISTPEGSSFKLFATDQDALKYYAEVADLQESIGWHWDPSLEHTGGNIYVTNEGDVYYNYYPDQPGGDDDPSGGGSIGDLSETNSILRQILEVVKKIYNQVIVGNIISGIDAVAQVFDTIKNYVGEALSDAAKIGELTDLMQNKFPFSLPQDILMFLTIFEAEPRAPVWTVPFRADFGGAAGFKIDEEITIDFSDFQDAINILNWFMGLLWLFFLFRLTPSVLNIGSIGGGGSS